MEQVVNKCNSIFSIVVAVAVLLNNRTVFLLMTQADNNIYNQIKVQEDEALSYAYNHLVCQRLPAPVKTIASAPFPSFHWCSQWRIGVIPVFKLEETKSPKTHPDSNGHCGVGSKRVAGWFVALISRMFTGCLPLLTIPTGQRHISKLFVWKPERLVTFETLDQSDMEMSWPTKRQRHFENTSKERSQILVNSEAFVHSAE